MGGWVGGWVVVGLGGLGLVGVGDGLGWVGLGRRAGGPVARLVGRSVGRSVGWLVG